MAKGGSEKLVFLNFSKVDQIGIVVKDMEATMEFYEEMFGIEPFPTVESEIDSAKLRIGLLQLGEVQIELIQVLEDRTFTQNFLKRGVKGFFVKDIEKELARLEKHGIKVLERGEVLGVVKFAYLDTEKTLGVILELIQLD